MTLTENVKHTAVFARLALAITAAKLVIRTSLAVTTGNAGAVHTIKGTAIGRIAATSVLVLVVSVGGMVEQDYACDFLDHFGVITVSRRNLECSGATGGNLNAVKLKLDAGTILVHGFVEPLHICLGCKTAYIGDCVGFFLCDLIRHIVVLL